MNDGSLATLLKIVKKIPEGILGAIAYQVDKKSTSRSLMEWFTYIRQRR